MPGNGANSLMCPVCGGQLEHIEEDVICKKCGYTSDPVMAAKFSESDKYRSDAAAYRLMSAADAYFSRKTYNEAYIGYSTVLDSDPHCLKAVFRLNITSQYLMYETASVYLSCGSFFSKTKEMLASALENKIDGKLMLTMCKDMLDFIAFNSEYERKYAVSHKSEREASAYIRNMLPLLDYTRFIMNCIIAVNKRESAFAAMNCFETASGLYDKILAGMEYYDISETEDTDPDAGSNHTKKFEPDQTEKEKAQKLYNEMYEIKQSIMKNADDVLYGELKAMEKNKNTVKTTAAASENFKRAEYESWRKRNEKEYISADRKNILFGIISKAAFVFAVVTVIIFAIEAVALDDVIGTLAASSVGFIAAGITFSALEKHSGKKRSFYSKLVHNGDERSSLTIKG